MPRKEGTFDTLIQLQVIRLSRRKTHESAEDTTVKSCEGQHDALRKTQIMATEAAKMNHMAHRI